MASSFLNCPGALWHGVVGREPVAQELQERSASSMASAVSRLVLGIVVLPFDLMAGRTVPRKAFLCSSSCWRCSARSRLTAEASRVLA
jgi:hypothetical protein